MIFQENCTFSSITTFKVGGPVRFLSDCETVDDVVAALLECKQRTLPYVVMGEGSNILGSDEGYSGVIIRIRIQGQTYSECVGGTVLVEAGAGVPWDAVVEGAALRGLWGIENLAGIPGTMGAAPVQNIGAYGTDLEGTFEYADVLDAASGEITRFDMKSCGFGYRESRFKHERNLIILRVALRLHTDGVPQVSYADLKELHDAGVALTTPSIIGDVVRQVRSRKFPSLALTGTAGSFFKNPIIRSEDYARLVGEYGAIPSYPALGGVKIPLAFILDRLLGLKGYRKGKASLFSNQPLVLVADQGATAADVDALAQEISVRVKESTGIEIEREVRNVPE